MSISLDSMTTRYVVRDDLMSVVLIEEECFDDPWTIRYFCEVLRCRNCIGELAIVDDKIVGYCVWEIEGDTYHILNLAVKPEYRRDGIASKLVDKLFRRLRDGRPTIEVAVRESNLAGHLFFKSRDFDCYRIHEDYFDNGETAYLFRYNLYGE